MSKILLLEDDYLLSQTLIGLLKEAGFEVAHAQDGEEALSLSYDTIFDLYLFDINVPLLNGIDVLKLLRDNDDKTPAFFISAYKDIQTITKAFEGACDDYIKKPFDFDELVVRIKAHIHKHNPTIVYGSMRYDLLSKRIFIDDKEVDLGIVEKAIFDLLMRNLSQTIDKEVFFDVMEKPSDIALRVHLSKLKQRFALNITNIKGIGYRLEKI
ncbi:MAG: response regulator transcription factor [Epsilonproteobacteria bacterium]|uniref:DNA-binding response regulator n=2 Tax=Sulfurospirillum cavolei TaxID=366522 RepID=A0A2D3W8R6_9BACT|nr:MULTISPECIES: response regulator transcription factor [Sulfurospirillum]KHG32884.1 MAG: histidine kinase [Sulfurospirillum sp. MES]MCD8543858.1 response regulator transcription factor [Sulfurospirillum cavolei]NCB55821.1 response regulator transcription factor [Campylobacterota bacterium]DAB35490.1 MAG TPA: DNA-binding response regulator [Sulfurospirillum cavolei]